MIPGVPTDIRGLDVESVTGWLARELPEMRAPLRFERVGDGRSNLTFLLEDASGETAILRRPPLGELLPKAHDMEREAFVMGRFAAAGASVPAPLAVCADPDVTGAPFYVMERVEGSVVSTVPIAERFDEAARGRMGETLVDVMAELHAVDVDAAGLGELGPRDGFVARQLKRMGRQWEASQTEPVPLVDELAERLGRAAPEQREVTIVHGDYRLGNVIVGPDGAVRGVVDWELCALGEPLADLGLVLAFWPEPGEPPPHLGEGITTLPGFPSRAEMIARYEQVSGRDASAAEFFRALALWKMTVIMQGVRRRAAEDETNVSAESLGRMVSTEDMARATDTAATAAGA